MKFLKILFVSLLLSITSNAQISTKEVGELILKHNLKNPDVVLRIGILESGSFTSRKAVEDNNIFGFETGRKKFNSYEEAVIAYKERIESRLKPNENYYSFLTRIGYAEDKNYIKKLKSIKDVKKYLESDIKWYRNYTHDTTNCTSITTCYVHPFSSFNL